MQNLAQGLYEEINYLRLDSSTYASEIQDESTFASDEASTWGTTHVPYKWNEGIAMAARHYLNERDSCGTTGDADGFGFRSILSAFYSFGYADLEF